MSARFAGCLAGPCVSANIGVGDILEGQLFAYGVGSSITIVDLVSFKVLCSLQGGHGRIPVTAIAWNPECHERDLRSMMHLKCASGDGEGRVVLWDVLRVSVLFKMTDPKIAIEQSEGVKSMTWVMHRPALLAVVLGPSTLVLWDARDSGGIVWHRDLVGVGSLHSLSVAPLDCRSVCLCGSHGVCLLVCFNGETFDRTTVEQYRVSTSGSVTKSPSNLHCLFANMENTLLVMLSTEILIFDLEFGQPLGTIALPKGHKPFKKLIAVLGNSISYGGGLNGGIDTVYALHEEGMFTTWVRASETLTFSLRATAKMVPKALRGMHGTQLHIMTSTGCVWRSLHVADKCQGNGEERYGNSFPNQSLMIVNVMSNGQLWRWHATVPENQIPKIPKTQEDLISFDDWDAKTDDIVKLLGDGEAEQETDTENGTVVTESRSTPPRTTGPVLNGRPELERVMCTLTGSVTHVSVLPLCLADQRSPPLTTASENGRVQNSIRSNEHSEELPQVDNGLGIVTEETTEEATPRTSLEPTRPHIPTTPFSPRPCTPILAAVTSSGSLEIVSLHKGCLTSIHPEILRSYSIHESRCRSVRWVGNGPLVVSFTSEKTGNMWQNTIVLTDVRTGESVPFRHVDNESSGMLGVRASPAGKYIIVLLKDAPSEIWLVMDIRNVKRVRHLEISFTSIDWTLPEMPQKPMRWREWNDQQSTEECFPLETLVFTVSDGRIGSISLQGKKVINSKVRLPGWANFGATSAGGRCIAIAAVGQAMLLGDYDGNLIRWDTESSRSETVYTDSGPVRRILVNSYLRKGKPSIRVALLSATWKCNIYDVDERGKLFRSAVQSNFRLIDIAWIPSIQASGIATLLSGITEDGNIIIMETDIPEILAEFLTTPSIPASVENHVGRQGKEVIEVDVPIDGLSGQASVSTTLALPKLFTLLLRLLIQVGTPMAVFEALLDPDSPEIDGVSLEDQIWDLLPVDLRSVGLGGDALCPTPYSPASSTTALTEKQLSMSGSLDSRGQSDAKKRARRRMALVEVSRGMSLASEVLKTIEAQNMRSKGLLGRVRGSFNRREQMAREMAPSSFHHEIGSSEMTRQLPASESLLDLLRVLALLRCDGQLLLPDEWTAYRAAVEQGSIVSRMSVAALVSSDGDEVEFWTNLTTTLATVRRRIDASAPPPNGVCLWDETTTVSMAQSRAQQHDTIPRSHIESHPELQEKRLLEYVSLGDYHTAVGFLLSSAPEASARYYRDSLCAYALSSVGTSSSGSSVGGSPMHPQERSSLHLQVAKVVSAHAASMGDSLLGVPLLCTAGVHHEAVSLLQDAALWSFASVLTASNLDGPRFAISCMRWAQYVWKYEGSLWRAVGLLTTGGCLREAAQLLVDAGYIDCAAAYCIACKEFDLITSQEDTSNEFVQLYSAIPSNQMVRVSSVRTTTGSHGSKSSIEDDISRYSYSSIINSYNDYVTSILTGL